jgi:hypothetical protein
MSGKRTEVSYEQERNDVEKRGVRHERKVERYTQQQYYNGVRKSRETREESIKSSMYFVHRDFTQSSRDEKKHTQKTKITQEKRKEPEDLKKSGGENESHQQRRLYNFLRR